MADMTLELFARFLQRSQEIAAEPDMHESVTLVYQEVLKPHLEAYLPLHGAVTKAVSDWAKENKEATEAVDALDAPFRTARSVVLAFEPTIILPETLKSQPTDTNKIDAVETLIDTVDDHIGTPWADQILAGEIGTKGPVVIREINEAIAANKGVSDARTARAKAYGPTYERFLRFKRVVRDALGPSSPQYRRIHGRAAAKPEPGEGGGGS